MKSCAPMIDRLFPEGTLRGELRKIAISSYQVIREQGLGSFFVQARSKITRREFRILEPSIGPSYDSWILETAPDPQAIKKSIMSFTYAPTISIVMPVYNSDEQYLREAIQSVERQLYSKWELCVCDDGSTAAETRRILREASQRDTRIKAMFFPVNKGIASATNAAIALAGGEFIGFLDHDDVLYSDALFEIVKLLNEQQDLDYIYSDEDKIYGNKRRNPFFKPDWSPDLLLSAHYATHFSVMRANLLRSLGGMREGYQGSQDYDLALRTTEKTTRIGHVKKPLYGWRLSPTSTAAHSAAKPYAYVSAMRALKEAMTRRGFSGEVSMIRQGWYRVMYDIRGHPPVTIIIPAGTSRFIVDCIESILKKTGYDNYDVLVIDGTKTGLSEVLPKSEKLKTIREYSEFNWSRVNNNAAKVATGEYLVFLNDDTRVINNDWLSAMLEHAQRGGVGAVGAKLLFANGKVQHAGIVVGIRGLAANYGGFDSSEPGYSMFALAVRNCTAVSGACMMVRKSVFMELGGFDESLAHSFNDVDFGIRIVQSGRFVVYTPFALLFHFEGGTRGRFDLSKEEIGARRLFREKHKQFMESGDPYYNPNLSLEVPYQLRAWRSPADRKVELSSERVGAPSKRKDTPPQMQDVASGYD